MQVGLLGPAQGAEGGEGIQAGRGHVDGTEAQPQIPQGPLHRPCPYCSAKTQLKAPLGSGAPPSLPIKPWILGRKWCFRWVLSRSSIVKMSLSVI